MHLETCSEGRGPTSGPNACMVAPLQCFKDNSKRQAPPREATTRLQITVKRTCVVCIPHMQSIRAACAMQDVSLEDNVVDGAPAGARAIGLWDGGRVFATPEMPMWQLPQGPAAASEAVANVSEFPVRFLDAGGGFRGLEAVRLWEGGITCIDAVIHPACIRRWALAKLFCYAV